MLLTSRASNLHVSKDSLVSVRVKESLFFKVPLNAGLVAIIDPLSSFPSEPYGDMAGWIFHFMVLLF